jgi:uroporphyrinogen decarboxylase
MTGRERFSSSIAFEPVDRPAKTDMFCLAKEFLGESFPDEQEIEHSTGIARQRLIAKCAEMYAAIAEGYNHDCVFVWHPFTGRGSLEVIAALGRLVARERMVLGVVPNALWGMEQIDDHTQFAMLLHEDRDRLHRQARQFQENALMRIRQLAEAGADVAYLPNDVAFNEGPYFAPAVFEEIVLPYAVPLFAEIRRLGMIGVYHTDGNVTRLLESIMALGAHALQSIDPMAGMDIKDVKKKTQGRLALLGNVQCNLLQEGPEEAIRRSAGYCLTHASPGSGYVFMASNSIFTGMPLANYHIMQDEYDRFVSQHGAIRVQL